MIAFGLFSVLFITAWNTDFVHNYEVPVKLIADYPYSRMGQEGLKFIRNDDNVTQPSTNETTTAQSTDLGNTSPAGGDSTSSVTEGSTTGSTTSATSETTTPTTSMSTTSTTAATSFDTTSATTTTSDGRRAGIPSTVTSSGVPGAIPGEFPVRPNEANVGNATTPINTTTPIVAPLAPVASLPFAGAGTGGVLGPQLAIMTASGAIIPLSQAALPLAQNVPASLTPGQNVPVAAATPLAGQLAQPSIHTGPFYLLQPTIAGSSATGSTSGFGANILSAVGSSAYPGIAGGIPMTGYAPMGGYVPGGFAPGFNAFSPFGITIPQAGGFLGARLGAITKNSSLSQEKTDYEMTRKTANELDETQEKEDESLTGMNDDQIQPKDDIYRETAAATAKEQNSLRPITDHIQKTDAAKMSGTSPSDCHDSCFMSNGQMVCQLVCANKAKDPNQQSFGNFMTWNGVF